MSRPLPPPLPEELGTADRDAFNRALGYWVPVSNASDNAAPDVSSLNPWSRTLLHSPPFALHRAQLSSLVRTAGERQGTYSHADREMVDMVLAPYLKTNVVQKTHIPDAIAVGVRPEAIEALYEGRDDDLTADERLLTTYIRQVVDGKVDDETFDAITARLGTRGVVEYTYFITVLWMTMRQFQAFGCDDPTDDEMLSLVSEIKEGVREAGDWRARIRSAPTPD
jgi:hypothetical protein